MQRYWKFTIASVIGVTLFAFDFELFLASIPGLMALFHFNLYYQATILCIVKYYNNHLYF